MARKWWESDYGKAELFAGSSDVTQCGTKSKFPAEPRFHRGELDLSVAEGVLDVATAIRVQFGRPLKPRDAARSFAVGTLLENQYWAYATPVTGNPQHGSVTAPVEEADREQHELWWADVSRVQLDDLVLVQRAGE